MLFRPEMDASDRAFYLRRALQEQEAAHNAACPEARECHQALANAYRLRCRFSAAAHEPSTVQNSEVVDDTA